MSFIAATQSDILVHRELSSSLTELYTAIQNCRFPSKIQTFKFPCSSFPRPIAFELLPLGPGGLSGHQHSATPKREIRKRVGRALLALNIAAVIAVIILLHVFFVVVPVLVAIRCFLDDLAEVIGIGHRGYSNVDGARTLKYKSLLAKLVPLYLSTLCLTFVPTHAEQKHIFRQNRSSKLLRFSYGGRECDLTA